jgi:hypothetical protein
MLGSQLSRSGELVLVLPITVILGFESSRTQYHNSLSDDYGNLKSSLSLRYSLFGWFDKLLLAFTSTIILGPDAVSRLESCCAG